VPARLASVARTAATKAATCTDESEDPGVATVQECRAALSNLAARLAEVDRETRSKHAADRTLSLWLTDLDTGFCGRLVDGELLDVEPVPDADAAGKAQLKLRCSGDDLIALTDGHLGAGTAWATGRLKIDASLPDLLRLRTLL
jgi:hypothetical protein